LWLTSVAALAMATAALADGDAPTDIYIIGVDSLTTFTSGAYAGLSNPNYGRLTLLYAHYTPGTGHFHPIGAWSYSGSRDNPIVRNTNSNNRIPELAQRDRPNGQRYLNLRPGSGAFAGKWISGQDGGEYSNLAMRPFDYLFGFQSDERVNRLINSSRGRWRTILPTNAIVGLQLMEISDGLNLAHSDGTPINLAPGQVLTLGTGADWVLNPVFWVADGAREGVYSVGFRLLDLNTSQGYTPLRDSGVFYFDLLCCNDTQSDYRHLSSKPPHTPTATPQKNCGAVVEPHPSPTPHDAPTATPDYAHHPQTCA
jgi:hypothetical protein